MVQKTDAKGKPLDLGTNMSKDVPLTFSDNETGTFASSFRVTDCNSLKGLLKYCRGAPSSPKKVATPRLGVHALDQHTSLLPSTNDVIDLYSPRLLYGNKENVVLFNFPPSAKSAVKKKEFHTSDSTDKNSNMLTSSVSKAYTVESVSTNSLQCSKNGARADTSIPTYTVVFLGELSVGKSALCKKFFQSGTNGETEETPGENLLQRLRLTEDDDFNFHSDQEKHSDSHHIYERPMTVDSRNVRLRILDINSEKHRNECGTECGDFEPFLEVGEAYALTYSIADRGTFQTVVEILTRMKDKHADTLRSVPVILVGNKCDLVRNRQVTKAGGIKLATEHNIKFIETSASLNENVTELFEGLIQQIQLRNSGATSDAGTSSTLLGKKESNLSGKKEKKESSQSRSNSARKKRRPKRVFTRRLTEFFTGKQEDEKSITRSRAKSCQDLNIL